MWRKRDNSRSIIFVAVYVVMSLLTIANRCCLAKELLISLSKAWLLLWSVLHILQNDHPLSTQMEGPSVESAEWTLCSMTVLVSCFTPVLPYYSILPKYEKESENPSPCSLLTFHVFAQLSHTSRSSASRRVVILSDLFLLARIILLLKVDIKRTEW